MKSVPDEHAASRSMGDMTGLVEEMTHHHRAPMPEAKFKPGEVFPRMVMLRLAAGVVIGSIFGLILGILLYQGIVTIPQAEELYSMGPVTFHCFWAFKGLSAGMVCFGIWGITAEPDQVWSAED